MSWRFSFRPSVHRRAFQIGLICGGKRGDALGLSIVVAWVAYCPNSRTFAPVKIDLWQ